MQQKVKAELFGCLVKNCNTGNKAIDVLLVMFSAKYLEPMKKAGEKMNVAHTMV